MAKLLLSTGEVREISPLNKNKGFTCSELYELLDCNIIEYKTLSDGRLIIIDEEGKLLDNPVKNHNATALYRKGRMPVAEYKQKLKEEYGDLFIDCSGEPDGETDHDAIYGHAVVCDSEEFK